MWLERFPRWEEEKGELFAMPAGELESGTHKDKMSSLLWNTVELLLKKQRNEWIIEYPISQ